MSFREDGHAAVDWAFDYLERGEVRRLLPASPPEQGEPFADVLRDRRAAGSAWVCPELRDAQAGVERADSLVARSSCRIRSSTAVTFCG